MDQLIGDNLNMMNGVACIFWSGFLLVSIYRQKIPFSRHGSVIRQESPQLFWLLIGIIGAIALWTGMAFVLHQA